MIIGVHSNFQVLICLFAGLFSWHPLCMSLGVSSWNSFTFHRSHWRLKKMPFSFCFLSFSLCLSFASLFLFCSGMINVSLAHGLEANRWIMHRVPELWIVHGGTVRWLGSHLFPPLHMSAQSLWLRLTQNTFPSQWRAEQRGVTFPHLICTQSPIVLCEGTSVTVWLSFPSSSNQQQHFFQLNWMRFGDYTECVFT